MSDLKKAYVIVIVLNAYQLFYYELMHPLLFLNVQIARLI